VRTDIDDLNKTSIYAWLINFYYLTELRDVSTVILKDRNDLMKPLQIKPELLVKQNRELDRALDQYPIHVILYYPPSGMLLQRAEQYLVRPRTELINPYTHIEYWHKGYPYIITQID